MNTEIIAYNLRQHSEDQKICDVLSSIITAELTGAENKILNIALPIGNAILMGNDVPEALGPVNENENRSKIVVTAASKEEADNIFHGLSAGGNVEMPIMDTPWGTYFAMFRDKFGIEWMVEYDANVDLH